MSAYCIIHSRLDGLANGMRKQSKAQQNNNKKTRQRYLLLVSCFSFVRWGGVEYSGMGQKWSFSLDCYHHSALGGRVSGRAPLLLMLVSQFITFQLGIVLLFVYCSLAAEKIKKQRRNGGWWVVGGVPRPYNFLVSISFSLCLFVCLFVVCCSQHTYNIYVHIYIHALIFLFYHFPHPLSPPPHSLCKCRRLYNRRRRR